jgi:simple sugar transport system substrate-binding protein
VDSELEVEKCASLALAAAQKSIHLGQITQATFGLSSTVFQAIEQGEMLFAIDQQPYLQGYLPIVLLTLYKTNLSTVMTPDLLTGPDFVTKSNVTEVQQSAMVGTY